MIASPARILVALSLPVLTAACSQGTSEDSASDEPAPLEAIHTPVVAAPMAGDEASVDEQSVRAFLRAYAEEAGASRELMTSATVAAIPETRLVAAYMTGPFFCGSGGCNLLILRPVGSSFDVIGDISVVRAPVRMLETSSNGLPDLAVRVSGGGAEPHDARLEFDGTAYPDNPTIAPAELADDAQGTVLIAAEAMGRPLYE